MMGALRKSVCIASVVAAARLALAAEVTLDLNGFANASAGQVTGPGLENPIPLPKGEQKVLLNGLQAGGTYGVDFFHNAGPGGSDFTFTLNEVGTGVAAVGLGGGVHEMVADFVPGQNVLKLKTHEITFNANSGQTGLYYIAGLFDPYSLKPDEGPQKLRVIPGWYSVDALYNINAGLEDFVFTVDSAGRVGPADFSRQMTEETVIPLNSSEYAEFEDSSVSPRHVTVRFRIEATGGINFHATHAASKPIVEGNVYELEMPMTVGGGGLNIWSFGLNKVVSSNVLRPDGTRLEGTETQNDFCFYPWLRYEGARHDRDEGQGFYFVTTEGKLKTARAEAQGSYDGGEQPLTVKVVATIVEPPAEGEREMPAAE